jgi:hypothetical protein
MRLEILDNVCLFYPLPPRRRRRKRNGRAPLLEGHNIFRVNSPSRPSAELRGYVDSAQLAGSDPAKNLFW